MSDSIGAPIIGVIMGSKSDWETMRHAVDLLVQLEVPHEAKVVSAHRTPELMSNYASAAESRGIEVIIAGAGGAAHLPGMVASHTILPVIGASGLSVTSPLAKSNCTPLDGNGAWPSCVIATPVTNTAIKKARDTLIAKRFLETCFCLNILCFPDRLIAKSKKSPVPSAAYFLT